MCTLDTQIKRSGLGYLILKFSAQKSKFCIVNHRITHWSPFFIFADLRINLISLGYPGLVTLYPRCTNNKIYISTRGTNESESSKSHIISRYTHNKIYLSTCGTNASESSKALIISPLYQSCSGVINVQL